MPGWAEPAFQGVAAQFYRLFARRKHGGGALAAYLDGEPVLDVWAGYADASAGRAWQRDTAVVCFSTTKGVLSTVLHRLTDRGLVDYHVPVARYWPDFAQAGKAGVTVQQVLSHSAGLHRVRGLAPSPEDLTDHRVMAAALARARPWPEPGTTSGYHAFTHGWLVAALIEHTTGEDVRTVLRRELAAPLGEEAMWLGAPPEHRGRVARLVRRPGVPEALLDRVGSGASRLQVSRGFAQAFLAPGFGRLLFGEHLHDTPLPAVNGVFTARGLAKLYGALANGGVVGGQRFLSEDLVTTAGRVQWRNRDYVLGWRMRWRLGYHQGFVLRERAPKAFGHSGFGGSGGWADPETGLALAFVTNRIGATTPIGDARMLHLGASALRTARTMA